MATTAKKILKFRNYRPADTSLVGPQTATSGEGNAAVAFKASEEPLADRREGRQQAGADQQQKRHEPDHQQAQLPHLRKEEEDAIQRELRRYEEEHGSGGQLNVAPRKPNWDLKRDVAKKVAKLNRLTQKAIVELLRERLAQEAEDEGSSSSESDSGSSVSEEESEEKDQEGKSDKE
ncbi:coiled-coil domain-containing protein 12 [Nannochloropsis oceanica]